MVVFSIKIIKFFTTENCIQQQDFYNSVATELMYKIVLFVSFIRKLKKKIKRRHTNLKNNT